jgi:hypothetical protein
MRARRERFLLTSWIDVWKYFYAKGARKMSESTTEERIKEAVRENYGGIARRFIEEPKSAATTGCCGPSSTAQRQEERPARTSCCGSSDAAVEQTGAARFYSAEELAELPETVTDASLGCGNPLAIAELQPGEVVLDLGSGGALTAFWPPRRSGRRDR